MATKVLMEALSPTMEEGRIARWLKKEGDAVRSGDVLAEVETDKAVMELAARGDGVLRKILVGDGATADVGAPVGIIAGADEDVSGMFGGQGQSGKGQEGQKGQQGQEAEARPAKQPVHARVEKTSATPSPAPAAPRAPAAPAHPAPRLRASPLARRLAGERSIDLSQLHGSGPGGRIIKRDLESAASSAPAAPRAPSAPGTAWEDVPLTQIRKTIARRLAQSIGPIPHFFLTAEADMEASADAREKLNALGDGPKISFNDIILKVVAAALIQHRECNAWWQDDHIRYFNEVHLAMAVAVEDGLITPVIRHAEQKTLRQIAEEAKDLAERARARKLKPEEYTGGTFSVSNLGMFEIDDFTAVINPPEAGIIAVGSITPRPVAVDGTVTIRRRMRITMSCDHRVIDGATGAKFLRTVKRMLENPLAIVW